MFLRNLLFVGAKGNLQKILFYLVEGLFLLNYYASLLNYSFTHSRINVSFAGLLSCNRGPGDY